MAEHELPQTFRLPASRQLQPLQQGDLDGLCGIYSIINAIRLVKVKDGGSPMYDCDALFSSAIHRLAETGGLRERISIGVPWGVLKRVPARLGKSTITGDCPVDLFPVKRGPADRLNTIKRYLVSGRPIIVSVHRDQHYTVLVGWTRKRAIIFDSSGGHWVPLPTIQRALCMVVSIGKVDRL